MEHGAKRRRRGRSGAALCGRHPGCRGWFRRDWSGGGIARGLRGGPKSAASCLQSSAYQADDDLVFCHPHSGKPLDRSKVRKRFVAAVKRAGVRRVRFHDLRHTFGTAMAGAGVPLRTLQEWMSTATSRRRSCTPTISRVSSKAAFAERAFGHGSAWALPDSAPVA